MRVRRRRAGEDADDAARGASSRRQAACWSTPASSTACRAPRRKRAITAWLGASGLGARRGAVPAARLVHLAPALLGPADPDHLLRRAAAPCRCRRGPAGRCCRCIEDFRPDDTGVSPLARHEEWYYVAVPAVRRQGRRETDVSDTFLDSAWYFLRYPSTEFDDRPFDPALTRKWLPVATYIGGNEHAVLHLLYSRFITMVLHDLGHRRLRGAVPQVPRARAHRERRRQDVEVAGQRRRPRRVHRAVGRRHLPHVPDVPRAVPGRRRLPRRRASAARGASSTRSGTWSATVRRRTPDGETPARRSLVEAAPDQEEGDRGYRGAALQHRDRGDDGAGERAAGGELHASARSWRSWSSCWRRSRRTSPRSAGSGWATTTSVFDARWPDVGRRAGGRGSGRGRGAGERQDPRPRSRCRAMRDEAAVVEAALADAAVRRFRKGRRCGRWCTCRTG